MGNQLRAESQAVSQPYAMATYLNVLGYHAQTTRIKPYYKGNSLVKQPTHQWGYSRRMRPEDTALMIMTKSLLVIDIDSPVSDIEQHLKLPENCWVEYTPSGGAHIYLSADEDISKFRTTIKIKLWNFDKVDILVNDGFAYAGGTTYIHPKTKAQCTYRWDTKRNPLTVPKLGTIPLNWKIDIITGIKQKSKAFVELMQLYLLGCRNEKCMGLRINILDYHSTAMALVRVLRHHEDGIKLIQEWSRTITGFVEEMFHKVEDYSRHYGNKMHNPYDEMCLRDIYEISTHSDSCLC